MADSSVFDRVRVSTSTLGTGPITLGAAVLRYRSFVAAGVPNGTTVSYAIEEGTAWELGTGVYNNGVLTRTLKSSSTGALINLQGDAQVFITILKDDLEKFAPKDSPEFTGPISTTGSVTGSNLSGTHSGNSSGTNTGDQSTIAGNAGTATKLETVRTINGVGFDGTANITVNAVDSATPRLPASAASAYGLSLLDDANAATARTTLGLGSLATQSGTFSGTSSGTNTGDQTTITGNAGSATVLQTARNINGVPFNGSANITINAVDSTARIAASEKGAANGVATLGADSKIPSAQLPALALADVSVAATQAAQLAIVAQEGDVVIRTDLNKTYIHNGGVAGTMADWQEMLTPTDLVTSVAGRMGAVILTKTDVGLSNVDNTSDAGKPVSTAQQTALNLKLDTSHAGTGGTAHAAVIANGAAGFMIGTDKAKLDGIAAGATANTGTVTAVGVTTLNGISGTSSGGATPNITLSLGAITPTSVAATGTVTGSNLSGTNTGDQVLPTRTSLSINNVDNTSDGAKPVSVAQQAALDLKLNISAYTAADILTKIKTVDGALSGLDADTLDGFDALDFAKLAGNATFGGVLAATNLSGVNTGDQTNITGNAGTATQLANPRSINGVTFNGTSDITISAVDSITPRIALSQKGAADGVATLGPDAKILASQLPALALTDVFTAASQAAQLALSAQQGDVAIRSDLNKSYIHNGGTAGTMADWNELLTPTDSVISVAGRTGAVTLTKTDVGLNNVDNTSDAGKPVSTAQQAALNLKLNTTHEGAGGAVHANVVPAGASGFMTGADKTKLDGIATGATANTGTVTAVSVVSANGISGTSSGGATPALTVTLGAITPTSVAATGTVTGSNLSGTNTGDQTTITGNAGTATKLLTPRAINGVNFDGSAPITINAVDSTARLAASAVSAFGLTLVDDVDAATARSTLGLGTLATQTGTFSGTHSGSSSGTNTGDQILPTRTSLGINNVDNTSDINKPVSTAQQTAINALPTKTYIGSRAQNLVTNGNALMKDNTNFSGWTYDSTDNYFTPGSFVAANYNSTYILDEVMPIDPNKTYRLSYAIKASTYVGARHYGSVSLIDADGITMSASTYMWSSPKTTLALPINPGDTTITLTNATGWNATTQGSETHKRGIILWNYVSAGGYVYPPETYSRNFYFDLWAVDADVNVTTGVITLKTPWAGPTIAAGTELSRSMSGGSYKYIAGSNVITPENWTVFTGTIGGIDSTGTNITNQFPVGAAGVRITYLMNRNVTGGVTKVANVSFGLDVEQAISVGTGAQYWRGDKTWQTLDKAAVGLGNVDNTTDLTKSVASAAVLTTARTINGVSFNGSTNITINAVDSTARLAASAVSSYGLTLIDDIDAATARTTLGLGTLATQSGTFSGTSSGNNTGDQDLSGYALKSGAVFTGAITATNLSGNNTGDQDLSGYALKSGAVFTGAITATNLSGTNTGDQTTITGNAGTATKLLTARAINGVNFDGSANITINAVDATARIASSEKGAVNGVATLDSNGKIITTQLPTLALTDVSTVASQAAQLALIAQEGDVAIRTDLNKSYIHNGGVAGTMSDWSELLTPTDSVLSFNSRTGAITLTGADVTTALGYTPTSVTGLTGIQTVAAFKTGLGLVKGDVGLGSVDNTADSAKSVASAAVLTTARTINGVSFNGSANITINAVDATARLASSAVSAFGLTLIDDIDAATARTTLGLGSVNNTADSAKSVASAATLTTPRTINGVSFNGSANITINAVDSTARLASSAVSAFGLTLIDDLTNTAARTTLGLGTLATQSGTFSGTSSGTNTGDETKATIDTKLGVNTSTTEYYRRDGTWATISAGGVTAVSVASANGITGTSSGGATPALTITLGDITPTSVVSSGSISSNTTIVAAATGDGSVIIGNDGNGNIELGKALRTVAGAPFIDFHSSVNSPDFDARIQATGGSSGASGGATLALIGALVSASSNFSAVGNITGNGFIMADSHFLYSASANSLAIRIGLTGPYFNIRTVASSNMDLNNASGGDVTFSIAGNEKVRIYNSGAITAGDFIQLTSASSAIAYLSKTGTNAGTASIFNDGAVHLKSGGSAQEVWLNGSAHRFASYDQSATYAYVTSNDFVINTPQTYFGTTSGVLAQHTGGHGYVRSQSGNLALGAGGATTFQLLSNGNAQLTNGEMYINKTAAGVAGGYLGLTNTSAAINTEAGIFFSPNGNAGAVRSAQIAGVNSDGGNGTKLVFRTNQSGGGPTDRMTIADNGAVSMVGNVTAPTFIGALSGNATTATKVASWAANPNQYGASRLYRRDTNDEYNVQTNYDGSRWLLRGYYQDGFHAECRVSYADNAGLLGGIGSGSYARYDLGGTFNQGQNFSSTQNTAYDGQCGTFAAYGNAATISFHRPGAYAINMGLDSDNWFRIGGWSAPDNLFQLDMSGNLTLLGNIGAYSDIKLKKNIETIPNALDKVCGMRGVTYNLVSNDAPGSGVIAQELELIAPELVTESPDGTKGVIYGNLVGYLIESIKELRAEIEELKGAK